MTLILGIESSCDESACAVVRDGVEVLSSAVASQIARHAAHGGVVPELAAREHLSAFPRVLSEALSEANVTMDDIDGIAVTQGPGLIPALLVGINFAKGLALRHRKPLYGVIFSLRNVEISSRYALISKMLIFLCTKYEEIASFDLVKYKPLKYLIIESLSN